jgi:hypothetical protein
VLAAAKAQRRIPAAVLRVLIAKEVIGRDLATYRLRGKTANLPWGAAEAVRRAGGPVGEVRPDHEPKAVCSAGGRRPSDGLSRSR